jgi:ketosteroid isomerase-like protein
LASKNVETVHRLIEAINAADLEAILAVYDPDVDFKPLRAPIQGAYAGHAGLREWWADTQENFTEFQLQPAEIRDIGSERVLAVGNLHLRGKGSGVEADVPSASLIAFRDGLIVALKDYGDREKALAAAGLSE